MKGGISTWLEGLWVKNMVCGQIKGAAGCIHTCQEVGVYMTPVVDSLQHYNHRLLCRKAYMLRISTWVWHSVVELAQLLASNIPTPRMIPREYKAGWSDVTTMLE